LKIRLSTFISIVALSFFVSGQLANAQLFKKKPKPAGAEERTPASCIWKVSDADSTVYLAGSVHLLRTQDYPIPPAYQAAYDDSARVVFEIDMNKMEDPELAGKIRKMGMFEAEDSLDNHLTKKTWRLLQRYIASRRIQALKIETMNPGFAFLTISSVESMRLGAKAELGLEKTFFDLSKKDVKLSSGLETMEFQLTLFDKLTAEEKDSLIRDTLQSVSKMGDSIDKMIGAWKVGDGKLLNELMSEEMKEGEKVRELMLTNRNKNWIPEIEKALEGPRNIFFLVGAGHLVGKDSVVELLRKRGHTLEQLSYDSIEPLAKAVEKAEAE